MVDRISDLADDLLFHILSFLPTEHAFATSLVSKRFTPLWFSVTNLDFDEIRCTYSRNRSLIRSSSSFINFVSAAILACGIHQPIKTLRLIGKYPTFTNTKHIETWLNAAADRKLENLQISGPVLPCTIFSIKTLVVLKLKCVAFKDFSDVELPSLKTLHLEDDRFLKSKHFIELLNGCPVLETLEAKHLTFDFVDDPSSGRKFTTLSKLVRADIFNIWRPFDIPVRTFCNVEFLRIESWCDVDIPIFPNLIHLVLIFGGNSNWEWVLDMLNHCPQLQTFHLENLYCTEYKVWPNTPIVPKCFTSQLRTCCLTEFTGTECEMTFAKFVMQNSALLHTMKFFNYWPYLSLEKILEMRKELESCPRSSASCELLFM